MNKDGTVVSYLQLAHNERHPVTGSPVAKVIHSFGRADKVDRAALARLVGSISRFLDPGKAVAAAAAGEVDVVDSRRMGVAWVLGRLWDRLEIGTAIRRVAAGRRRTGRDRAGDLRAGRAAGVRAWLEAGGDPVGGRAGVHRGLRRVQRRRRLRGDGLPAGRAGGGRRGGSSSVAHLLNLDVDIVFVDTTSTYWEMEVAAGLAEAADRDGVADEDEPPREEGARRVGHSEGSPR